MIYVIKKARGVKQLFLVTLIRFWNWGERSPPQGLVLLLKLASYPPEKNAGLEDDPFLKKEMVPSSGVFSGSGTFMALGPVIAMSEGTFGDLTDLEKKIVSSGGWSCSRFKACPVAEEIRSGWTFGLWIWMHFLWEEVRIVTQAICHKKGVALLTRKNNPSELSFNNPFTTRNCVSVALSSNKLLGQNTQKNIHPSFSFNNKKFMGNLRVPHPPNATTLPPKTIRPYVSGRLTD